MFTRRHYEWMAATVKEIEDRKTRRKAAFNLITKLLKDNKRFDSRRFLHACYNGEK